MEKRIVHTRPKLSPKKRNLLCQKCFSYDLGFSVDCFQFTFPSIQEGLQEVLTPFSELINKTEAETKGFDSKDIFKLPQETPIKTVIVNYIKKLTVKVINESYFQYDKRNFIKETFIRELNKKN